MKKPTDNRCWKQFWWYWTKAAKFNKTDPEIGWKTPWAYYLSGRIDQADVDSRAICDRPELVPNQN